MLSLSRIFDSRLKMSRINWVYLTFWGLVSFVSSNTCILEGRWSGVIEGNLLKEVLCPIFFWIAAFFGDYLYNVYSMNKSSHMISEKWTKTTYFIVELIFLVLITSVYWTSESGRTVCVFLLFLSMMMLKAASLCAVCPRQNIVKT